MVRVNFSIIFLWGALATYLIISKIVFEKVYITSKVVVDEEFHLQLGQAYCTYKFDKWHPKVTTFPGLYLLSSLLLGLFAVLFRQTNIIWVGMIFTSYVLHELSSMYSKKPKRIFGQQVSEKELIQLLNKLRGDLWMIFKQVSLQFWLNVVCYSSSLIFFIVFVYFNGSIVVGDKSAHEVTIHIPQLFYFSIFCFFFAWPYFITEFSNFFNFIIKFKVLIMCAIILCLVTVHLNTLVHPYMLADNRHYVFYVWNRFYGKYFLFRYLMVLFYLFSWFVIIKKLCNSKDITFILIFIPCTAAVLVTQKLLEFRYFLIPYILFRIKLNNVETCSLIYEFLTYCILNMCTLQIFFTKTIQWDNYNYPQRLIW